MYDLWWWWASTAPHHSSTFWECTQHRRQKWCIFAMYSREIPLQLWVPTELPFPSILQKQNSWYQKANQTWDDVFFHSPERNPEAWYKLQNVFHPFSQTYFCSILSKQAERFKLTCHLSSQEEATANNLFQVHRIIRYAHLTITFHHIKNREAALESS